MCQGHLSLCPSKARDRFQGLCVVVRVSAALCVGGAGGRIQPKKHGRH